MRRAVTVGAVLVLASCASHQSAAPAPTPAPAPAVPAPALAPARSLYERLGGRAAIAAVVDTFTVLTANDPKIAIFFRSSRKDPEEFAAFKRNLTDQICQASGGPCRYTGKSMKEAHAGMGITSGDFSALVADLIAALTAYHVPPAEQQELLAILGPLQSDIVTATH
jgi:hemoglobin